jgi:hypothetical protein
MGGTKMTPKLEEWFEATRLGRPLYSVRTVCESSVSI